ncbi:hypothetical protein GW931_00540 [archaeon]|nr:hypothetical protein [archaeon]
MEKDKILEKLVLKNGITLVGHSPEIQKIQKNYSSTQEFLEDVIEYSSFLEPNYSLSQIKKTYSNKDIIIMGHCGAGMSFLKECDLAEKLLQEKERGIVIVAVGEDFKKPDFEKELLENLSVKADLIMELPPINYEEFVGRKKDKENWKNKSLYDSNKSKYKTKRKF